MDDAHERLDRLKSRLDSLTERVQSRGRRWAEARPRTAAGLGAVRDLFFQDVTTEGLRDVFARDPRDALRYFSRRVDFDLLARLPWYKRYPTLAWEVFRAMAYRLSPGRRMVFVAATVILILGWADLKVSALNGGSVSLSLFLLSSSSFFLLLVLELRDKLVLKGDLEIAREIQFGLVPAPEYRGQGLVIHSLMRPANTVGGDYYDLIPLPEGGLAFVVGDVSGKGIPAALLMALLQGSLRTLLTAGFRGSDVLAKLNQHLCANIPRNRLITLFYAELDGAQGRLRYVNAGHNSPFLLRAEGSVERLAATGLALGILSDARYDVFETEMEVADRLVLYTDGVSEAFNPADEEYGEARLQELLTAGRALSGEVLLEDVVAAVLAFGQPVRPHDDMTLMAVELSPRS